MIYGDKPVDDGIEEYEAAWQRAENELVGAYWDDPWGILSDFVSGFNAEFMDADLSAAMAPNPKFDRDAALSAGLALARLTKRAREAWVERRRDEILAKGGR